MSYLGVLRNMRQLVFCGIQKQGCQWSEALKQGAPEEGRDKGKAEKYSKR